MVHVDLDCPACGVTISNCGQLFGPEMCCYECDAKLHVRLPSGYRWLTPKVPDCAECGKKQKGRTRRETYHGEGWCDYCHAWIPGYPDDEWGEADYETEEDDEISVKVVVSMVSGEKRETGA